MTSKLCCLYTCFPTASFLIYICSSINNLPSLRAASQFVSSISSYQYTRKAWRREVFELLLEPCFFQMDLEAIGHWTTIVDNLMTHDKTTYKDLMGEWCHLLCWLIGDLGLKYLK